MLCTGHAQNVFRAPVDMPKAPEGAPKAPEGAPKAPGGAPKAPGGAPKALDGVLKGTKGPHVGGGARAMSKRWWSTGYKQKVVEHTLCTEGAQGRAHQSICSAPFLMSEQM